MVWTSQVITWPSGKVEYLSLVMVALFSAKTSFGRLFKLQHTDAVP